MGTLWDEKADESNHCRTTIPSTTIRCERRAFHVDARVATHSATVNGMVIEWQVVGWPTMQELREAQNAGI